jgi:UDP-N-acetylglucosamine 2-epimerase
MLKVLTLVGTRPEIIKLSCVIAELERHIDHVLVHSGQNYDYELNEVFFKDLGLPKPKHFLEAAAGGPAETIARVIERFDKVLEAEAPDAVLLLGDTNSCLGIIAAKRRKIPIFHMEAGNRCFDQRVPEEINRKVVDHLSDINLVYTEHARRYLLAEGIAPDTVIKTGSPMREVLNTYATDIETSDVLSRLSLESGQYFLVSAHREENVDSSERLQQLIASLSQLSVKYGKRILFSVHPRTRARLEQFGIDQVSGIEYMKPLGFFDYIKLQKQAFCVVSDSGTITEEASILGFPAITIREAHERPEGMDEGSVVMTGLSAERILQSVQVVTSQDQARLRAPADYSADNVSSKVLRIILSYTDFVNKTVWRK